MTEEDFTREFWVTRDGRILKISEIDNDHLLNILKMIERKAAMSLMQDFVCLPEIMQPRGDGAQMAFEDASREAMEAGGELGYEGYHWLLEEAIRRGITTEKEREDYGSRAELAAWGMFEPELKGGK